MNSRIVWYRCSKVSINSFQVVFGSENPFDLYGNGWDDEKSTFIK